MHRNSSNRIFPVAINYPSFFLQNLLDPSRVIKHISGNNCAIRAFYYQFLKLMFQLQVKKEQQIVDYQKMLINLLNKSLSKKINGYNQQYIQGHIQTVISFIQQVNQSQDDQFQRVLEMNPKVDKAFIQLFSIVLKEGGFQNSSAEQIIGYLCQIFDLRVTQIQKCIKFQQSDVFLYVQNQYELFLAFMNLDCSQHNEQPNEPDNSIDNNSKKPQKQTQSKYHKKASNKIQNDTIINIFGDMLHSSKHQGDSKVSNSFLTNLNNSMSPGKRQQENKVFRKTPYSGTLNFLASNKEMNEYIKTNDQSNFIKYQQPKYQSSNGYTYHNEAKPPRTSSSPDDILYRPKNILPTLQEISQVTASKQSLKLSHRNKRDPLDFANQQQKGTFYRQFTNTRILNILPQPQRTNVKMLKNRFIGVHSRNQKKHII